MYTQFCHKAANDIEHDGYEEKNHKTKNHAIIHYLCGCLLLLFVFMCGLQLNLLRNTSPNAKADERRLLGRAHPGEQELVRVLGEEDSSSDDNNDHHPVPVDYGAMDNVQMNGPNGVQFVPAAEFAALEQQDNQVIEAPAPHVHFDFNHVNNDVQQQQRRQRQVVLDIRPDRPAVQHQQGAAQGKSQVQRDVDGAGMSAIGFVVSALLTTIWPPCPDFEHHSCPLPMIFLAYLPAIFFVCFVVFMIRAHNPY